MRTLILVVATGLWALSSRVANAQGCDQLLREGIFETFVQTSGNYRNEQWHQAWCNGTLKRSGGSEQTGVSLDLGIIDIPLGLSFDNAKSFQEEYRSQYCSVTDTSYVDMSQKAIIRRTASPALVAAYMQCRAVEPRGLTTAFEVSPDGKVFTISMRYNRDLEEGAKPKLKAILFGSNEGVVCSGTLKPPMKLTLNSSAMLCKRTRPDSVSILIDTDAGAFTRHLPAIEPPPSDQERVMRALPSGHPRVGRQAAGTRRLAHLRWDDGDAEPRGEIRRRNQQQQRRHGGRLRYSYAQGQRLRLRCDCGYVHPKGLVLSGLGQGEPRQAATGSTTTM